MIRLRTWIERALERRWLGLFVLAVLVILLLLVASHSLSDAIVGSAALVCMAAALLTTTIILTAPSRSRPQPRSAQRAPPTASTPTTPLLTPSFAQRSVSLRR